MFVFVILTRYHCSLKSGSGKTLWTELARRLYPWPCESGNNGPLAVCCWKKSVEPANTVDGKLEPEKSRFRLFFSCCCCTQCTWKIQNYILVNKNKKLRNKNQINCSESRNVIFIEIDYLVRTKKIKTK